MACFKLIITKVPQGQIQIKKVENFEAYVGPYDVCSFYENCYCNYFSNGIVHNKYIIFL